MKKKDVGKELHRLHNLIKRKLDHHGIKKQIDALTGTNSWIISYLMDHEGEDIFQRDLEKAFTITRSTVSKELRLMEEKGFLIRKSVPQDARLKKLVLTDRAREIDQLIQKDHYQLESELTKGFQAEELELLFSYIERMKENLK